MNVNESHEHRCFLISYPVPEISRFKKLQMTLKSSVQTTTAVKTVTSSDLHVDQ